jgi:integrase
VWNPSWNPSVARANVTDVATGSIEELKGGSFRVAVYAGKDPFTGRKVYLKESHATHELALAARDRLLIQVESDQVPDRAATLSVLLRRWMEVADHSTSTAETTSGYVRRTLDPALGDVPLRKLQHRVDLLDRLYTHLRRCNQLCDGRPFTEHARRGPHDCAVARCRKHRCRPMSPAAIRRVHAILSAALGYAVSWGWIEKNPAEYAHPPKLKRRRAKPPDAEQVARLLNLAWETGWEVAMFLWLATTTGARRGELVGLRWSAVNLRAGLIHIEKNYVVRAGQHQLKETKTDTDRRLSMDALTMRMLTDFQEQRAVALAPARVALAADAFVFSPDPAGMRPWHPDHFTHAYRKMASALGMSEPLKNLRHFNATQLLAAGVDLRTTAGRLGHTDGGATTLKVYADWMPATDRKAAEQLAADLAKLRSAHPATDPQGPGQSTMTKSTGLPRAARPIDAILDRPPEHSSGYLDVMAGLQAAIETNRLVPDDLVPTVSELADWYNLARSTAQRAVSALGQQGLISRSGHRWTVNHSVVPRAGLNQSGLRGQHSVSPI